MSFYFFKNRFDGGGFQAKSAIAGDFLLRLDELTQKAGAALVTHSFSPQAQWSGKVLSYHNLVGPDSETLFAMRAGSAIEAQTYALLAQWRPPANERPASRDKPGDYLIEQPSPRDALFPSDFRSAVAGQGSRPDIRLALGGGYEALFDLTAEKSAGHILDKGGGHWLSNDRVLLIAEVFYSQDQIAEIVGKMKF